MTEIVANLDACAREPIHIPGSIQPHGLLLALEPDGLTVTAASANAGDRLGRPGSAVLGASLRDLLQEAGDEAAAIVEASRDAGTPTARGRISLGDEVFDVAAHRSEGLAILELEPVATEGRGDPERLYADLGTFLDEMRSLDEPADLCALAARKIRELTGYDRVLAYRFDRDWHGTVIAEDGNGVLPSYLGLRFPGSDIPAQARELYRRNRLRLIPDAYYEPSPIEPDRNPLTGGPLDLSQSMLRSVSPVHVEYMRNMGTGASMSASILSDDELWGLVSCHNAEPKMVPMRTREAVGFIARILSMQIAMNERSRETRQRVEQKTILSRLLARMAEAEELAEGLTADAADLLAQADADAAAIAHDGRIIRVGPAPEHHEIERIVAWLEESRGEDVFATDQLSQHMPEAAAFAGTASGLLAASISSLHPSYLMWFRGEIVRTVQWGGDPHKPAQGDGTRLHPRNSFDVWKEQVRLTARPWLPSHVEAAVELRNAIIRIVLRQAEERARLTGQLQATNKELESFSYSISHDLRAPFRHIVGYSELLRAHMPDLDERAQHYLDTITESAVSAGRLVDDLLRFSQLGRTSVRRMPVDLEKLVAEAMQSLEEEIGDRTIEWRVDTLPEATGRCGPAAAGPLQPARQRR